MSLTEDKINELWDNHEMRSPGLSRVFINPVVFARAIEAEVRAEAKQEPVGDIHENIDDAGRVHRWGNLYDNAPSSGFLYAAPVVQPDMVMVPMEPTEKMQFPSYMGPDGPKWPERKAIYRAMIAAAQEEA